MRMLNCGVVGVTPCDYPFNDELIKMEIKIMVVDEKKLVERYEHLIELAFREDFEDFGDITTDGTVPAETEGVAVLVAKENGILCGLDIFKSVFDKIDNTLDFKIDFEDGDVVKVGEKVLRIEGSLNSILKGERIALNFIQRLSGISTFSNRLAKLVEGTKTEILDTRKTLPGFRLLDKYAVKTGGATNHRIGLYDMFMIKDNHIEAAGSIQNAIAKVKKYKADMNLTAQIEVEVKNIDEYLIALAGDVDVIMLDNMDNESIAKCLELNDGKTKLEVSGNVTEERVKELAHIGVDFISLGALTHSVKALDLSLLVS